MTREYISRPPRFPRNKICKILYITQIETHPPVFVVFINHKNRANFSFKRWLENVIRKEYGFVGVPLVFDWRERQQKAHSQHGDDTAKLREEFQEGHHRDLDNIQGFEEEDIDDEEDYILEYDESDDDMDDDEDTKKDV